MSIDIDRSRKYGKWTPIRPYGKYWICECECGVRKRVYVQHLKHSQSLGCKRCANWKGCGDIPSKYWSGLKKDAKRRRIPFKITIEEAWKLFLSQQERCALTGDKLIFAKGKRLATASLDRICSRRGYTPKNVQWVHKKINRLKNTFSQKEFVELCQKVSSHSQSMNE